MVRLFKNIFKNNKQEQTVESAVAQNVESQDQVVAENALDIEKKPKHGEDGVCCGGCS